MSNIFISYSHDSERHKTRVRELAEHLRAAHGLRVVIDQDMLPGGPDEGWSFWSEARVREAAKVLVVCTENYCRRYLGREQAGVGLGAVCEARLIHEELRGRGGINHKYRVVLFEESCGQHVPDTLQDYHKFPLYREEVREELADWLMGRKRAQSVTGEVIGVVWPKVVAGFFWGMANRKELTGRLERMLSGESERQILLMKGESNSGKTHTLRELQNYAGRVGIRCSYLNCKGCPALQDIWDSMVLDLAGVCAQGRLAMGRGRGSAIMEDLQQLRSPVLLILDTYEEAPDEVKLWVEAQLLQRTGRSTGLEVVIAGQNVPDKSRYAWVNEAEHVVLEPIRDAADWHEYTQRQGIRISLDEVGLLALAGQGRPGVIYPLLENIGRVRTVGQSQ
jgi:hypothetical protein